MPGYSKEELERVISIVTKKVEDARERSDDREVALHSQALNELTQELGQMLAQEELASRAQAQQNEAMQANLQAEQSQMQETMRTMQTMGKRRARQAWSATKKHAPKVAAGAAAGVAAGAMWTHDQAKQGLQKAAQGAGYVNQRLGEGIQNTPNGMPFFILAVLTHIPIYMAGGLEGRYGMLISVAFVLSIAHILFFRSLDRDSQRIGLMLIWAPPVVLAIFAMAGGIFSADVSGLPVIKQLIVLFYPLILWYMALGSTYEVSGFVKFIGTASIVVLMIVSFANAGGQLFDDPNLPSTGIDVGEALADIGTSIGNGFRTGLRPLLCSFGFSQGCGFVDWLDEQLAPFTYDATTVHKIQNERLGIYISDLRADRPIDMSGSEPGRYLPEAVEFTVYAPIPPDIEFDLCSTIETIGSFKGLCEYDVTIGCEVEDVSASRIEPRENVTLRESIASSNQIFRCRLQIPDDANLGSDRYQSSTKQIRVFAQYPFVTTTFKLIRLVDIAQLITPEVRRAFESFSEDSIISAGGPVIIETDENERMAISDRSTHPMTFRLVPQEGVRIESVQGFAIYVPDGLEIDEFLSGSYCQFVELSDASAGSARDNQCAVFTRVPGTPDPCAAIFDETGSTAGCEDYYEHAGSEDDLLACRALTDTLIEQITREDGTRPGSFLLMKPEALDEINRALAIDPSITWRDRVRFLNDQKDREIRIQCTFEVTDKEELLDPVPVTERTIQAIALYTVEHSESATVRFEGYPEKARYSLTPENEQCTPNGQSASIPKGLTPYASGQVTVTSIFGEYRAISGVSPVHRGIDLVGSVKTIVSSWNGQVVEVCREGVSSCGSFGSNVLIRSSDGTTSWTHRYAHLNTIDRSITPGAVVRAGDTIGTEGNTGRSTGSHLHFEVVQNGAHLDPFILIYEPGRFKENEGRFSAATSQWRDHFTCEAGLPRLDPITAQLPPTTFNRNFGGLRYTGAGISCNLDENEVRMINDASVRYGVPASILVAVAAQETNCEHTRDTGAIITSSAGARGMFQITEGTKCSQAMSEFGVSSTNYAREQSNFAFHAQCAANILVDKYLTAQRADERNPGRACGSYCECSAGYTQTDYRGWKAAVKGYHGWGCFDTETQGKDYEENVEQMTKLIMNNNGYFEAIWNPETNLFEFEQAEIPNPEGVN